MKGICGGTMMEFKTADALRELTSDKVAKRLAKES